MVAACRETPCHPPAASWIGSVSTDGTPLGDAVDAPAGVPVEPPAGRLITVRCEDASTRCRAVPAGTVDEGTVVGACAAGCGGLAAESRVASTLWHWADWQLPGTVSAPDPDCESREAACTPPEVLECPGEACVAEADVDVDAAETCADEYCSLVCGLPLPWDAGATTEPREGLA